MNRTGKAALLLALLLCLPSCGGAGGASSLPEPESSTSVSTLVPESGASNGSGTKPEGGGSSSAGGAVLDGAGSGTTAEDTEEVYLVWPHFLSQTMDSTHHTLTLDNPAENPASIQVVVQDLDTGATLYQSGVLAPGAQEVWDVYTAYQSGTHSVELRCTALGVEERWNTLRQTIQLTLS